MGTFIDFDDTGVMEEFGIHADWSGILAMAREIHRLREANAVLEARISEVRPIKGPSATGSFMVEVTAAEGYHTYYATATYPDGTVEHFQGNPGRWYSNDRKHPTKAVTKQPADKFLSDAFDQALEKVRSEREDKDREWKPKKKER